ncbi:hypothetical protein C8N40_109137 [Pontibacter mucosus]|uniref:Uncharacterized protein n=1 Tax=Pontibacter mucosus TaxID=1649266 RepID=A0A2T5YE99_9BACT|nr:hypothetical protein C8N40_109137 [Pontibacter mucosus]
MTLMSFASLEDLPPPSTFVRTQSPYMVAIEKINHIGKRGIWLGGR